MNTTLSYPTVMGHRGAPALAPENTLEGFELAATQHGLTWFELDVVTLADGTPVVAHDDSLMRCAGVDVLLSELSHADLQELNPDVAVTFPGGWPSHVGVPTLDQVLHQFGPLGLGMNLELKLNGGMEDEAAKLVDGVAASLARCPLPPRGLVFSSFNMEPLERVRAQLPQVPRALISVQCQQAELEAVERLDCQAFHIDYRLIGRDREALDQLAARGIVLGAWTVNDASADLGPVGCAMTDDPRLFGRTHNRVDA